MPAPITPASAVRTLESAQRHDVHELISSVERADGARPLSDHLWLDLHAQGSATYHGLLARSPDGLLAGYGQLQPNGNVWSLETVVAPAHRDGIVLASLLDGAKDVVAAAGGGEINWWALQVDASVDSVATTSGFHLGRLLHQMRRALPLPHRSGVEVRPFVVGRDEGEWLRVNNAAFSGHPEQGNWTPALLAQREAEPWFDPAGFLLHERDGTLAAFCWTKVHEEHQPPLGEIYVIAVDPAFHGLGLGKALTVAGLDHLASVGITVGMLYVDGDNAAGVGLYQALGFTIHHTDRAYLTHLAASDEPTPTEQGASA